MSAKCKADIGVVSSLNEKPRRRAGISYFERLSDRFLRIYSSSSSDTGMFVAKIADPHSNMKGSSPCWTN